MNEPTTSIRRGEPAPPCVFVIFGATGDLTKRKLIPALYNLREQKLLRDEFAIVAIARKETSDDELRAQMRAEFREFAGSTPSQFRERLVPESGGILDADPGPGRAV